MTKSTELLVLSGGFGTRLKTILDNTPKTLAPVGDKTFLYLLLRRWVEDGYKTITLLLHYEAQQIKDYIDSLKKEEWLDEVSINFIEEEVPLGTGGSIANAVQILKIKDPFLITNSDTWLFKSFKGIEGGHLNSVGLVEAYDASRFGSVDIKNECIISFNEKSHDVSCKDKLLINAGVYFMHPNVFMNHSKVTFSIETEIFPQLALSRNLKPYLINGSMIDIGIPEDYKQFCNLYEKGNLEL